MPISESDRARLRDVLAEAEGVRRNGPASDGRGWFRTTADRIDCYAVADAALDALAGYQGDTTSRPLAKGGSDHA